MTRRFVYKMRTRLGLGLLETVIALSILITGAVTLMSLVSSAGAARIANEYESLAANLAREGVEVAVARRNDNWINDRSFDNGFFVGTDYSFGAAYDPNTVSWSLVNNSVSGMPNALSDDLAKVFQLNSGSHSGLFVQGTVLQPVPLNSVQTIYRRLLVFDPICFNGVSEQIVESGATCSVGATKIGVRAKVTVSWSERNRPHSISVIETLYDWR